MQPKAQEVIAQALEKQRLEVEQNNNIEGIKQLSEFEQEFPFEHVLKEQKPEPIVAQEELTHVQETPVIPRKKKFYHC